MRPNVEQAFGGTQPMLALIERIYASVVTPELWDGTLSQIANHLGGESIALFAGAPNAQTPHLLSISAMDHGAWAQFATHYAAINPIMQRCEKWLDPSTTWYGHAVMTDAELEHTEFYADFFQRNRMHHSVGMRLDAEGLPSASLSCQRPRSAERFDTQADTILQTLRPHLTQALSLRRHLGAMQAQAYGFEAALDAYDHAVIGIDSYGHVALCSTHAQGILRGSFGLSIQDGRLVCNDFTTNTALQHLIRTAAALVQTSLQFHTGASRKRTSVTRGARRSLPGSSLLLQSPSTDAELRLTVLPHRRALPGQSAPLRALIFFSHSGQQPRARAAMLIDLYRLTLSEARIADLLASGLDLQDIATQLQLTRETARFYVKRILAKTNTHRQIDLVRMVLSIPSS